MAVGINSIWECRATATASNANGAGFNPEMNSANLLADLTTDANTANTNSPVVSSASYNFAASDQNAYLFLPNVAGNTGGNWIPGWYLITSVAGNKATLSAAVGAATLYNSPGIYRNLTLNTLAGCATVGTPTGGIFAIDYSQQNAARIAAIADFAAVGGSSTLTSATAGFTPVMVGNFYHQTTTGTGAFGVVGWYEITAYTNATTVTLDRTPNNGTASVACTGYVGGAASLQTAAGATDDSLFENGAGTNGSGAHIFFIKSGTYTSMGAINVGASGGTQAFVKIIGYDTSRTLTATGSNRPFLNMGTGTFIMGQRWAGFNLSLTGTGTSVFATNLQGYCNNIKAVNTSTTAARDAFLSSSTAGSFFNCEGVSLRGRGISVSSTSHMIKGCWFHDSDVGIRLGGGSQPACLTDTLITGNQTSGITISTAATANYLMDGLTIYGNENKIGTGLIIPANTTSPLSLLNCILYGLSVPINSTDAQNFFMGDYNNYYNNTSGNTNFPLGQNDVALDPQFTNVVTRSGSTATTNTTGGNHLVDANATFQTWGIQAGDIVHITGGTAGPVVCGYSILSVDSETQLTLGETVVANATADHTWYIVTGNNFAIGANLKAKGFPGVFPGGLTTGYLDIGAAQRQEQGSSSSSFTFGS